MPRLRIGLAASLFLAGASHLAADELVLSDGSTMTGRLVMEGAAAIAFETVVDGRRTTLTIDRGDYTEVRRGELPDDFFEGTVPAREAAGDGDEATTGTGAFAVLPINGAFGTDITPDALSKALSRVARAGIGHVVLAIDATPGYHDPEALRDLIEVMERYHRRLSYHALVTRARGEAAVLALAADSIHLTPGAEFGGVLPEAREDASADELAVILRRAAQKVADLASRRGINPLVARALIDPAETLAVWRDADGTITVGPSLPEGTSQENTLLVEDTADQVVVFTADQLAAAGRTTVASAAELGAVLEIEDWTDAGPTASEVLRQEVERGQASAQRADARLKRDTDRILDRRDVLVADYEHAMAGAEQYDPTGQSYETIRAVNYDGVRYRGNGLGWRHHNDGGSSTYDTNKFTRESRNRRQRDIDITIGFLGEALEAIRSMRSNERRADRLGIERAFSDEELDRVEQDVDVRRRNLAATRNDRGR